MQHISERAAIVVTLTLVAAVIGWPMTCPGEVKAWKGTIAIPTYPWQDDLNPKFWAMEGASKLSTTVKRAIIYPYTMQDHLSREKVDRTYQALFLENEYLKITCLPELGGRLHSVLDKTTGQEVFHLNRVIKPSMIAMRGAFISGGVEWNAGPQVHTVTIVSPVDATLGRNTDGSAFLEISNLEQSLRTRWTVRLTLHPGRSYLDERISLYNPNDATRPYYFWNCTAQPCLASTRFIYPMTLGTDHYGREFFDWPVDKGKDLSWLKNYYQWASIFSVGCRYDFFGAYHVEPDRGVVQVANHDELPGKKAWTWGDVGVRSGEPAEPGRRGRAVHRGAKRPAADPVGLRRAGAARPGRLARVVVPGARPGRWVRVRHQGRGLPELSRRRPTGASPRRHRGVSRGRAHRRAGRQIASDPETRLDAQGDPARHDPRRRGVARRR